MRRPPAGKGQNRYPSPTDNLAGLLEAAVEEKGLRGKAIGYEGGFETIAPNCLSGRTPRGIFRPLWRRGEPTDGGPAVTRPSGRV